MKPIGSTLQRQEMPEEEEDLQMKPIGSTLQRQEMPEEEEDLQMKPMVGVQREAIAEDDELQMKPMLQRVGAEGGAVSDGFEQELNAARGGGQALTPELQTQMGQAMGTDFSGVRVHTDGRSDALNQSVGARAFTTGQDVFFKQGEYQPGSRGGQELIAHELTHVVQQSGGIQKQEETETQQEETETQQEGTSLTDTLRSMLEVYGPVHLNGLIEAIHSATVPERQAALQDTSFRSLAVSRLGDQAVTVMSSLLEGAQNWVNPPNNDFFSYFVLGEGSPPTDSSSMNCWESILYAAYLSNQINAAWIRSFYLNALATSDPNALIWSQLGWSGSLPQYPQTTPTNGQFLFYYSGGDPYPGHVAISLGGDQAMSLWNQPNNVSSVQRIRVTDLPGTIYIGAPPW
ncbi:MAG: DUF4157 domain-containing protein [Cyanothece sp. SIO2G6]|nr:DUF4157 domain-containing protein [Cyanothece sp. SIO2G6]